MPVAGQEARAASPCGLPEAPPAPVPGADDAPAFLVSAGASPVVINPQEAEESTRTLDDAVEPVHGSTDTDAAEKVGFAAQEPGESTGKYDEQSVCSACGEAGRASERGVLLVCSDCGSAVHKSCYDVCESIAVPLDGEPGSDSGWQCDCCAHKVSAARVACVYCCQSGSGVMRVVDTTDAAWRSLLAQVKDASAAETTARFGHLLCIAWDPWSLASRKRVTPETEPATQSTEVIDAQMSATDVAEAPTRERRPLLDPRSLVAPDACCFCGSGAGVRIQCRRLHCARFFHAMCASKDDRGYLERVNAGAMSQYYAYCARHRACREDVVTLLEMLVSKPVASLVGRDDARRLHSMLKRAPTYTSVEAVLGDLATLLVGLCHKGLRTSRRIPPTFLMKHLQVLQLFLDHVPQLEITYALRPIAPKTRVGDAKVYQQLVKTFNPPRYLSRFPGPLSQQHACAVCSEPFLERQHLFYCTNAAEPHEQHWQCTTRALSNTRDHRHGANGSSKKKKQSTAATVANGVWTDVKQPTALSSVSGSVVCAVCASPVDLRGLIASDKDAKHSAFEKKPSIFAYHGSFINAADRTRTSRGSSPAIATKTTSTGGRASENRLSRRQPAIGSAVESAKALSVPTDEPTGPVELAPPKMERINVQRTARWLACIGQIIRLAGRAREAANTPVGDKATMPAPDGATPTASSPDLSSSESVQQQHGVDEPMPTVGDATETPDRPESSVGEGPSRPDANEDGHVHSPSSMLTVSVDEASRPKADVEMESVETAAQAATKSETANPTPDEGEEAVNALTGASVDSSGADVSTRAETDEAGRRSLLSPAMQAYFDEAIRVVSPYDPYALERIETAREMLAQRSGPGVAVLRMLAHEYTQFVHAKHVRAADKVRAEKRKREELEAQQRREREKRRVDREAELALKKKMLAMRKKQRARVEMEQA